MPKQMSEKEWAELEKAFREHYGDMEVDDALTPIPEDLKTFDLEEYIKKGIVKKKPSVNTVVKKKKWWQLDI
jgi:hypothetical protein